MAPVKAEAHPTQLSQGLITSFGGENPVGGPESSGPLNPSANNYDDAVGSVWIGNNPPGYDGSHQGTVYVPDPNGADALGASNGGYYDNR